MANSGTVRSKDQITIPQEIPNRPGLKEGDRVEFVIEDDHTTILPARDRENPFLKYAGALPAFSGAGEINGWVRRLREAAAVYTLWAEASAR
ncbi:MAG: AbrB/MazE/SpoVT family DNA-binding domain-containing protein [Terriglobia bacterium]